MSRNIKINKYKNHKNTKSNKLTWLPGCNQSTLQAKSVNIQSAEKSQLYIVLAEYRQAITSETHIPTQYLNSRYIANTTTIVQRTSQQKPNIHRKKIISNIPFMVETLPPRSTGINDNIDCCEEERCEQIYKSYKETSCCSS